MKNNTFQNSKEVTAINDAHSNVYNTFPLSEEFLSFLDSEKKITPYYIIFPAVNNSRNKEGYLYANAQKMFISFTEQILRDTFIQEEINYAFQKYNYTWILPIGEAIKNAYDHTKSLEQSIHTALLLGNKGIGFGINDGEDFFKQKDVVELIKNRETPSEEDYKSLYKTNVNGHRRGFEKFYSHSDFIDVNQNTGTLYLGFSKDRILTRK